MSAKLIRAAAAQVAPDLNSLQGTLRKVLDTMDEAAAKGVELIVFPETFVPYYPYFSFVYPAVKCGAEHLRLYENAVVVPGPVTDGSGRGSSPPRRRRSARGWTSP